LPTLPLSAFEDLAVIGQSQAKAVTGKVRFHGELPLESPRRLPGIEGQGRLFAHSTASSCAFCLGHHPEAVTLAGGLALAGVFSGFAIVLTGTTSDAIAMYLGVGRVGDCGG
jgi:hypothetical protein